jgi:hypothetical protein
MTDNQITIEVLKQAQNEKYKQTSTNLMKFLEKSKSNNYLIILFVFLLVFVSLNPMNLNKIIIIALRIFVLLFNLYIIILIYKNVQKLHTITNDAENILLFSKITNYSLIVILSFVFIYSSIHIVD